MDLDGMNHAPVVRHFVHQAISHSRRGVIINFVLSLWREIVWLLDLVWPDPSRNSDHPQELVDIVSRVSEETTEYDEHVAHVVLSQNRVCNLFAT